MSPVWAGAFEKGVDCSDMNEHSGASYPSFAEAIEQFRAFVRGQGMDRDVVHVNDKDIVVVGRDWFVRRMDTERSTASARATYETAVARGMGVSLAGVCLVGSAVGVHIYGPVDQDEAERLMYPNGLKLSLVTDLPKATSLSWAPWVARRLRERLSPGAVSRRADLLK